jgi:hypothetical protein
MDRIFDVKQNSFTVIAIVIIGIMCLELKTLANPIPPFETEPNFGNRYNCKRAKSILLTLVNLKV